MERVVSVICMLRIRCNHVYRYRTICRLPNIWLPEPHVAQQTLSRLPRPPAAHVYGTDPLPFLQDVVRKVEAGKTDGRDRPVKDVVIADCGHEALAEADYFSVTKDDATA